MCDEHCIICHLCFWVILENAGQKFRNQKSKIGSSNIAVTITMKDSKYRNGLPFTYLGGLIYSTIIQTQCVVLEQCILPSQFFFYRGIIWWYDICNHFRWHSVLKYLSLTIVVHSHLNFYYIYYSWFRLSLILLSCIPEGEAVYFSLLCLQAYLRPF